MQYKKTIIISSVLIVLMILFLAGPKPSKPTLSGNIPDIKSDLLTLENNINSSEARIKYLDPANRAEIIWADSIYKSRTKYSVVYLHGFGGTWMDGYPANIEFAERYGCNLFLSRLYLHGIVSNDPLLSLTAENYTASAGDALAVGKALGDSVILMATSTGATLALILAAEHPEIKALILYSPNIDLYDSKAFILTMPWGLQIARLVSGSDYREYNDPYPMNKYWLQKYRLEAVVEMKNLLNASMTAQTFAKIYQPVFMGYYYKNESQQDNTVSVKKELEMFAEIGTPEDLKREISFPEAEAHAIASSVVSKDAENVKKETFHFAEQVLKLKPFAK